MQINTEMKCALKDFLFESLKQPNSKTTPLLRALLKQDSRDSVETKRIIEALKTIQQNIKNEKEESEQFVNTLLANCAQRGIGFADADKKLAYDLCKTACEQHYPLAQYVMARCLRFKSGCQQNALESIKYYKEAVRKNIVSAQIELALIFEKSTIKEVPKDATKAEKLRQIATHQSQIIEFVIKQAKGKIVQTATDSKLKAKKRGKLSRPKNWKLLFGNINKFKSGEGADIVIFEIEAPKTDSTSTAATVSTIQTDKKIKNESTPITHIILYRTNERVFDPTRGLVIETNAKEFSILFYPKKPKIEFPQLSKIIGNVPYYWNFFARDIKINEKTAKEIASKPEVGLLCHQLYSNNNYFGIRLSTLKDHDLNEILDLSIADKMLTVKEKNYITSIGIHKLMSKTELDLMNAIQIAINNNKFDDAINAAKTIHENARQYNEERHIRIHVIINNKTAFLTRDDATAAFELGEGLMSISPEHAYRSFEIILPSSPLYSKAQDHMGALATNLAIISTDIIKRRAYREKAMGNLVRSIEFSNDTNIKYQTFLQLLNLLESQSGYDALSSNRIFGKAINIENIDYNTFFNAICKMANKLFDIKKHASTFDMKEKNETQSASTSAFGLGNIKPINSKEPKETNTINNSAAGKTMPVPQKKSQLSKIPKNWKILFGVKDIEKFKAGEGSEIIFFERKSYEVPPNAPVESERTPLSHIVLYRFKHSHWDGKQQKMIETNEKRISAHFYLRDFDEENEELAKSHSIKVHQFRMKMQSKNKYFVFGNSFPKLTFETSEILNANPKTDGIPDFLAAPPAFTIVISNMKKHLLIDFLKELANDALISDNEINYILNLNLHKPVTLTEQNLLKSVQTEVNNGRLDKAIEIAKKIHADAIALNEERGVIYHYEKTEKEKIKYPLDDATIAFKVGEYLISRSPQAAYRAFEILTKSSPLFEQAKNKMSTIQIGLLAKSGNDDEAKRSKSIMVMKDIIQVLIESTDQNEKQKKYLVLLELLEGYSGFNSQGGQLKLFKDIVKFEKFGMEMFFQIMSKLADALYDQNRDIEIDMSKDKKAELDNNDQKDKKDTKDTKTAADKNTAASFNTAANINTAASFTATNIGANTAACGSAPAASTSSAASSAAQQPQTHTKPVTFTYSSSIGMGSLDEDEPPTSDEKNAVNF